MMTTGELVRWFATWLCVSIGASAASFANAAEHASGLLVGVAARSPGTQDIDREVGEGVRLTPLPEEARTAEQARRLGVAHGMDVVVWGEERCAEGSGCRQELSLTITRPLQPWDSSWVDAITAQQAVYGVRLGAPERPAEVLDAVLRGLSLYEQHRYVAAAGSFAGITGASGTTQAAVLRLQGLSALRSVLPEGDALFGRGAETAEALARRVATRRGEALDLLQRARLACGEDTACEADVLVDLAFAHSRLGDLPRAQSMLDEALVRTLALGEPVWTAGLLVRHAVYQGAAWDAAPTPASQALYEEARRLLAGAEDHPLTEHVAWTLAHWSGDQTRVESLVRARQERQDAREREAHEGSLNAIREGMGPNARALLDARREHLLPGCEGWGCLRLSKLLDEDTRYAHLTQRLGVIARGWNDPAARLMRASVGPFEGTWPGIVAEVMGDSPWVDVRLDIERALFGRVDHQAASLMLAAARRLLSDPDQHDAARAVLDAESCWGSAEVQDCAEEKLKLLSALGVTGCELQPAWVALASTLSGHEALDALLQASAVCPARPLALREGMAQGYLEVLSEARQQAEVERALARREEVVAVVGTLDAWQMGDAIFDVGLARLHATAGHVEEVIELLDAQYVLGRFGRGHYAASEGGQLLASGLAHVGRTHDAVTVLQQRVDAGFVGGPAWQVPENLVRLSLLHEAAGEDEAAREAFELATSRLRGGSSWGGNAPWLAWMHARAAATKEERGEVLLAAVHLAEAGAAASQIGDEEAAAEEGYAERVTYAADLHQRAMRLFLDAGRPDLAVGQMRAALEALDTLPGPHDGWRAALEEQLGGTLRALGEEAAAREADTRALVLIEGLGRSDWAVAVRARLAGSVR